MLAVLANPYALWGSLIIVLLGGYKGPAPNRLAPLQAINEYKDVLYVEGGGKGCM